MCCYHYKNILALTTTSLYISFQANNEKPSR